MYPFIRMSKEIWKFRNAKPLALGEPHISYHRCWPHDLDFWMELNNGRTLTLYDLGRIPAARRNGLVRAIRENGWGLTVAGNTLRYRRRIRMFDRIEMRSRVLGWDHRFLYLEQSMWRMDGECANHALYRTAITSSDGIVPPERMARALGFPETSPELPDWVQAWIAADAQRPWPPQK